MVVASNTRLQVLASNYDADALPTVSGSLKRPIIKRVEGKNVFYRKQAEMKVWMKLFFYSGNRCSKM